MRTAPLEPLLRGRPVAPSALDARQATAHGALIATMGDHLAAGLIVPCLDELDGPLWTSRDSQEAEAAAVRCQDCPAILACGTYAVRWAEPAGTWAGKGPEERAELTAAAGYAPAAPALDEDDVIAKPAPAPEAEEWPDDEPDLVSLDAYLARLD